MDWTWLQDLATIAVICVGLWMFVGDALKRLGLQPLLIAVLDGAHQVARAMFQVVRWIAYPLIAGRPAPDRSVKRSAKAPLDEPRSPAFTNTGTEGSSAFASQGTARTPDPTPEPAVHGDGPDFAAIAASMERHGYLCLSRADQETARQLVYQIERQARFEPGGQRSKTEAIERATGLKRGGSVGYRRASAIYDAVVGKPDPVVVAPTRREHQEAVNA